MSDLEPNDPVWNVLGQAKEVEPSSFFARNVVREARRLEGDRAGLWSRVTTLFSGSRAIFATAACAVVAMALVFVAPRDEATGSGFPLSTNEDSAEAFDPASEIANVEYLGQLMAVADPGQLDDAALADLFF
jgi:hypothetical protein